MARKKRRIEPVAVPAGESKEKPRYQDRFQTKVGGTIEEAGKKLEGHGRTLLYVLAALVVFGMIAWFISSWSGRSSAAAQAALGRAIQISGRRVTDTPVPAGSTEKVFKTERERAEAAVREFQSVAEQYGGDVGKKARYFAATNQLLLDRQAAISQLEELAKADDEVGKLSKFALAQTRVADGRPDEAATLYQELAGMSDPIVSKETINFELAKIYEKQGRKQEAVDLLFDLVKAASEVKDQDGKAVPLTSTAESAKEKLEDLDPERAKQLPQPASEPSLGGFPFGQ